MTKEALATCSHCAQTQHITIYPSINVHENPELRDKVKDGSLFVWECPHCGRSNLARYETLYHDPERKLMVWAAPSSEVSETQMRAISYHTKAMGGYTLRLVDDTGDLIEKILIDECGLDDMLIELCKYVMKMELASKLGEDVEQFINVPLHFHRFSETAGERFLSFVYPYKGQMNEINVGFNVYEDCGKILERNPDIKPSGDGFLKIDAPLVNGIMK